MGRTLIRRVYLVKSIKPQGDEKSYPNVLAIEYPDPGSPDMFPLDGRSGELGSRSPTNSSHADSLSLTGDSIDNLDDSFFDQQSNGPIDESKLGQHAKLFRKSEGEVSRTVCYPEYKPSEEHTGVAPQTICYAEHDPNRVKLGGEVTRTICYPDETKKHKGNRGPSDRTATTTVCYGDLSSSDKYLPSKPNLGGLSRNFSDSTRLSTYGGSGPKLLEWPSSSSQTGSGTIHLGSYVQGVKARFASSLPGGLPGSVTTLAEVQKRMDSLRLRMMPHRGSQLDRILHRAEGLAESVHGFLRVVQAADPAAAECSHLVMTFFKYLTYVSPLSNTG